MKQRRRPGHLILGRREVLLVCALVGIAVGTLVLAYLVPTPGQVAPLESDMGR